MKFFKHCILAVLGLLMTVISVQAASFSDLQVREHPCLDETPLPWRISPAKMADIPEAYKGWSSLWSGRWYNKVCSNLVIKKITPDGTVDIIYSTGKPFPNYFELTGVIVQNGQNQELRVLMPNKAEVTYTLFPDPSPLLQGLFGGNSRGTFIPVLGDN